MKKRDYLLAVMVTISFCTILLFAGTAVAKRQLIFSLGSGGTGGTYYPMMAAVAEVLTNDVKEIKNATAQVTAGSFENVRLLQNKYVQIAITNAASIYDGYRGNKPFKKKLDKLRTICWGHGSDLHIVALKGSGIKTFEDTVGKRFSIGAPGSGCQIEMKRLLETYGYTYKDFKIEFLSYTEAVNALKDGRIDVGAINAGIPVASVMDLAIVKDIHLFAIPEKMMDKLIEKHPIYAKFVIPAGTYRGIGEDLKVLTSPATFSCIADLSEDIVYKVTKAVYKKIPWLIENIHKGFERWVFSPDIKRLAPLHPGAVKFYKEIGKM
jgi:TRAP transporter TAXI family solute receptor